MFKLEAGYFDGQVFTLPIAKSKGKKRSRAEWHQISLEFLGWPIVVLRRAEVGLGVDTVRVGV
jgi:hypothetical protein